MCEECLQTPCHPRCPNAAHTAMYYCSICGTEIYEGDTMYVIEDENICEECVLDAKTTAEVDDCEEW